MATADKKTAETTIDNDALGLLDCFFGGVEKLMFQLAEHIARARIGEKGPIEINVDDVKNAAANLTDVLKSSSEIPPDVKEGIDVMFDCMSSKISGHCT